MKKIREYHICDRCFKEIEKPIIEYDYQYMYELCEECDKCYKDYDKLTNELIDKIDKIRKDYKFGQYIPKNELEKGE